MLLYAHFEKFRYKSNHTLNPLLCKHMVHLLQSKQPHFMSVTMTSTCSTKLKSNSSGIHNFPLALLSLLSNPQPPI